MSAHLKKLLKERDLIHEQITEEMRKEAEELKAPSENIRAYLVRMDEVKLMSGNAALTIEEATKALRDVYLLSMGEKPEHNHLT